MLRPLRPSPLRYAMGVAAIWALALTSVGAAQVPITSEQLRALHPRPIGPAVAGGRIHDVEALPDNASVIYVATASGGLWKTTNRGHTWRNIFENMPVSTFGDVAIAPSDPDILYAATGEQNNRQSTSWGNGVYRSDDAGESWRHLGLVETRHIGKVEVDPHDPDVVYVAALGNLWMPSPERGVFKSADGGATWAKVLFVDDLTGVVDLVMDPSNPDVLYAAAYQRLRRAWGFNGGGPGSGIYKTSDGGLSWTLLTAGLPEGDKGRIGLALAASEPSVVMATVQTTSNETQGTYRSEDAGLTWERVNPLNPRPMYYSEIFIDPTDDQRVYVLGTSSSKSEDGGRTFELIADRPAYDVGVHADHHALWIDPLDSDHIYLAGDAGFNESYDRGTSFRKVNNLPIGQFYAIGIDMRDPYWVYGGMQDNHSWMGPSETRRWIGIVGDDWQQVGFGDGMFWDTDFSDPRFAYGASNDGSYFRLNTETGDMLNIEPSQRPGDEPYRFDWTSPLMVSKHDPSTVYLAGNRLFISRDRGESWERTEDLSRQIDRDDLELMGVKGEDISISRNDGTGSHGEAVTLDESPMDASVLWVGFDDGNLQVSRDAGTSWTEVSGHLPGLPDGTYVSRIEGSVRGPGVAYATFDAHRDGDFRPYLYRTSDFGATWSDLSGAVPEGAGSANVVLEHPDNPDVLFLGTEHHLYVSTDAGGTWALFPNLPTTHYDDLKIHPREKDLVIATHGASIWILDDTRPLIEWSARVVAAPLQLFSIGMGTLFHYWKDTSYRAQAEWHGVNPGDGVVITYHVGTASRGDATLRVADAGGNVVREIRVPGEQGLHRVNWDLRHGLAGERPDRWRRFEDDLLARSITNRGPFVSPGTYTVTLESGDATSVQSVIVRGDPLQPLLTEADYERRERFVIDAATVMAEIQQAGQDARQAAEEASGSRTEEMAELGARARTLAGQLRGAIRSMDGGEVQQGSLHPPTRTMEEQLEQARQLLARLREVLR